MLILLIRFQHFIFHFDLSVSEFFENLDVFVGVLIQRNPLIIIFIKVIHDLTGQLFRLVRRHTIFSYQMIFYLLKIDEAVATAMGLEHHPAREVARGRPRRDGLVVVRLDRVLLDLPKPTAHWIPKGRLLHPRAVARGHVHLDTRTSLDLQRGSRA